MIHLNPTAGPLKLVATIPGVPDAQARALDRRRRLTRQLQSFRAVDRGQGDRISPVPLDPAGPIPA